MPGKKLCEFCGHGKKAEKHCGKLHQTTSQSHVLVAHHKCMQYSSGMTQYQHDHFGGFDAVQVKKEIDRGKRLVCSYCKKEKDKKWNKRTTAATAGCLLRRCRKTFHYYCARLHAFTSRRKKKMTKYRGREMDVFRVFCSAEHKQEYQKSEKGKDEYSCSETDEDADTVKASDSDSVASISSESEYDKTSISSEGSDVHMIRDSQSSSEDDGSTDRNDRLIHGDGYSNNDNDDNNDHRPVETTVDYKVKAKKEASDSEWTSSSSDSIQLNSGNGKRRWRRISPYKGEISLSHKSLLAKRKHSEDQPSSSSKKKVVLDSSLESSLDSVHSHLKKEYRSSCASEQDMQKKDSSSDENTVNPETQKNERSACKKTAKQNRRRGRDVSKKNPSDSDARPTFQSRIAERTKIRPQQVLLPAASTRSDSSDLDDHLPFSCVPSMQSDRSGGQSPQLRKVQSTGFKVSSDVAAPSPHSEVQKDTIDSPGSELLGVDLLDTLSNSSDVSDALSDLSDVDCEQTKPPHFISLETDKLDPDSLEGVELPVLVSRSKSTENTSSKKGDLLDVELSDDAPNPFLSQESKNNSNLSASHFPSHLKPAFSDTSVEKLSNGSKSIKSEQPANCSQLSGQPSVSEENTSYDSPVEEKEAKNSFQMSSLDKLNALEGSKKYFKSCLSPQMNNSRKGEYHLYNVNVDLNVSNSLNLTTNNDNEFVPHLNDEAAFIRKENVSSFQSSGDNIEEPADFNHNFQKERSAESSQDPQKELLVSSDSHGGDKTNIDQETKFLTFTSQTDPNQLQEVAADEKMEAGGIGDEMKVDGNVKTLQFLIDGMEEGASCTDNERKRPENVGTEFLQAEQSVSSHATDYVLLIPADARHFERVAVDVQREVAEGFNMETKQVHFWSVITPVLLRPRCMLHYLNDIVSTLRNQDWDQLRLLLTDAATIQARFDTVYMERVRKQAEFSREEKAEAIASLVKAVVRGLSDACNLNGSAIGTFTDAFSVNFMTLTIDNICDQDQILRKTLQQRSALYQWKEGEVSFASFDNTHDRLVLDYHLQESLLLQNWFTANINSVFKVIILPQEEVLLNSDPNSASDGLCFAQLKSNMEELQLSSDHICESDRPAIVFIRRTDRDMVCFERYLQACLKKYTKDLDKKRLICVFHIDNLSVKKWPQLDLGRSDCQVNVYTAFNPQDKPVSLLIVEVERKKV